MRKLFFIILAFVMPQITFAEFSPHEVMPASKGKQDIYVMDAIIRGGDPQAAPATLENIRWAKKAEYERIVLDITGVEARNSVPPYFQVGLSPNKGKISIDIKSINTRKISQKDLDRVFGRSTLIRSAYIAPKLQGELASLDFTTKATVDVEAFYLVNPPRIILDVRAKK